MLDYSITFFSIQYLFYVNYNVLFILHHTHMAFYFF